MVVLRALGLVTHKQMRHAVDAAIAERDDAIKSRDAAIAEAAITEPLRKGAILAKQVAADDCNRMHATLSEVRRRNYELLKILEQAIEHSDLAPPHRRAIMARAYTCVAAGEESEKQPPSTKSEEAPDVAEETVH